jgi:Flp pilus assembly protein TadD
VVLIAGSSAHADGAHDLPVLLERNTTGENHDTPVIGRVDAEELAARLRMRRQILRGERLGDDDLAVKALATAARLSGQNSKPISLTGYIFGRSRRTAEARHLLGALETASRQRYVPPYALALVHAGLGDADAAFEWLNRAYAARRAPDVPHGRREVGSVSQ